MWLRPAPTSIVVLMPLSSPCSDTYLESAISSRLAEAYKLNITVVAPGGLDDATCGSIIVMWITVDVSKLLDGCLVLQTASTAAGPSPASS